MPFLLFLATSTALIGQQSDFDPQAEIAAICKPVLAKAPSVPVDSGTFRPDCNSSAFYFGIGRTRDFVAARKCAYSERTRPDDPNSGIFAGAGVLSMIYANGEGTTRNTALARRFVCQAGGSLAEVRIRLDLLNQIDKSDKAPHFDLCDTATSGFSEGWCQAIDSDLARIKRNREIETLISKLSPKARAAFVRLQRAESVYENARAQNEVDLSGTGRAAFQFQEEDVAADEFLSNVRSLHRTVPSSFADPEVADEQLNLAYAMARKKLPARGGEDFGQYGTIGFDGVQKTERVWLQLRDRWMDFVRIAYPSYPRGAFLAKITSQRTKQLRSLVR